MVDVYETVAETRPRLRRDVLFTQTTDGVRFHNAKGSFRISAKAAYRLTCLLIPYLNGENRVADFCAGLGESQRAMVAHLVGRLYECGFARDVPVGDQQSEHTVDPPVAERFAAQINYVDHFVDQAGVRFRRFRDQRVAVLADDLIARWCVLSLIRNGSASVGVLAGVDTVENDFTQVTTEARELTAQGCPARIDYLPSVDGVYGWADLDNYDTVVVSGPAGHRQLLHLLRAGVPQGRTLLPAWIFGNRVIVGPLMVPGSAGCFACAVLRLGENTETGAAADIWSGICLPTAVAPIANQLPRPLAAMIGNLLGYEVFRIVTEALPAETRGHLIIQDLDSFDVVSEPLLPHPRCPVCTGRAATDEVADQTNDVVSIAQEAVDPSLAPLEELAEQFDRRLVLVQPHTGVFSAFTDERWTQTPIKVSTLRLATGHGTSRQIAAFDVHHVAGARMRAMDAAAVVYAEHVAGSAGVLNEADLDAARLRFPSIAPASLAIASGTGATVGHVVAWTVATSLLTKETVLVPAAAVRTFGAHNRQRVFAPTSAGTGAGGAAAEAAGRGLLSALCFDAVQRSLRGTGSITRASLEAFDSDAELSFLARSARNLGVDVDLLDLGESERTSAHVVLACVPHGPQGEAIWTVSGDLVWRQAAAAALRDLIGQVQLGREVRADDVVDLGDPLVADLDPATLVSIKDTPGLIDAQTSWSDVLDRLRGAGRDALAIRTSSADLIAGGISTVRVLLADAPPDAI